MGIPRIRCLKHYPIGLPVFSGIKEILVLIVRGLTHIGTVPQNQIPMLEKWYDIIGIVCYSRCFGALYALLIFGFSTAVQQKNCTYYYCTMDES